MCYNCGCEAPDDDMGKGKISEGGVALTDEDFKLLAEKWGMSEEEAKRNTFELLKKQLAQK